MRFTQISNESWKLHFSTKWNFIQYMWYALLENDRGFILLKNLEYLKDNLKQEPLSEFENDRDLKNLVCQEHEAFYHAVNCLPEDIKNNRFILSINANERCLILSIF